MDVRGIVAGIQMRLIQWVMRLFSKPKPIGLDQICPGRYGPRPHIRRMMQKRCEASAERADASAHAYRDISI